MHTGVLPAFVVDFALFPRRVRTSWDQRLEAFICFAWHGRRGMQLLRGRRSSLQQIPLGMVDSAGIGGDAPVHGAGIGQGSIAVPLV